MLDALGIARPTERYGRLPRSVRFGPHREGVFVFAPPSAPFHALMVEFFQSRAAPATMRSPDRVVEGETKTPGYYWVLTPREVRALVMWLRQHTRSQNAQRLANRLLLAYRGYLIRQNGGTPPWPRGKGPLTDLGDLGSSGQKTTDPRVRKAAVRKVVKACESVLKEKFGAVLTEKRGKKNEGLGCGWYGCVYRAKPHGTGPRKANVVKVVPGTLRRGEHGEIAPIAYVKSLKRRSHTCLPTFRRVARLGKCADAVGIPAYVVEREDLVNVPNRWDTRLAVKLLDDLEHRLWSHPMSTRNAEKVTLAWEEKHRDDLLRLHRVTTKQDPLRLGWRMIEQVMDLHVWLTTHGLTMSDVKLDNLGLRVAPLRDGKVEVVFRDIGLLSVRSRGVTSAQRHRFHDAHKRLPSLGAFML